MFPKLQLAYTLAYTHTATHACVHTLVPLDNQSAFWTKQK